MTFLSNTALPLALYPLIATQGLYVKFRAAQLSEPSGARSGRVGKGPVLRLLILGDSSAASVGVETQDDGLAGRLVAELSADHTVVWQLVARCGDTTQQSLARLATLPDQTFDVVLTALGVNDAKNGVTLAAWKQRTEALHVMLLDRFNAQLVVASGLPPVQDFPLLPDPLRGVLAQRCRQFDAALQDITALRSNVVDLPGDIPLRPDQMSRDGFHPNAEVYGEWALRAARVIRRALA